jgi:diguanylate cyclase (GGDEF)-like protein
MSTAPVRLIELPRVAVGVVAGVLVGALVLLLPLGSVSVQMRLFDVSNLLAAVLATGCAAWRARRSVERHRWSWWAMAAACGMWSVGQVGWLWLTLTGTYSYPSPADVAYFMFPVLACLALVLHPSNVEAQRARRVLDALMTSLAVGLIIWRTALSEVVRAVQASDVLARSVTIAYPVLDVLLLVLAVLTLVRTRLSLGLVTAGLTAFAVADIAFVHDVALGIVVLTPVDLGWGLGFAGISLSALARPEGLRAPFTAPVVARLTAVLPYVPVAVALVLTLAPHLGERPGVFDELTVSTALVVLLLVRQYLTLRQNWRLTAEIAVREAQLRHQAFYDGLTGLANRALFRDRLEHAVALHARDLRPISVLFLDLDDFKIVNDTLGHAVGDELLVRVSERLRGCVRSGDTVARLGGDEFALLLEDGADPFAAASRITATFETPFDLGAQQIEATVSVGVVERISSDTPVSADQLLARADTAMYAAKRSGKGRIVGHSAGMSLVELEDQRLGAVLREAITRGDIWLAYQPIVDLQTGRTVALEALARWTHEGSDIPPVAFIPAATRTGVLAELTDALLAQACTQLASWTAAWKEGAPPLAVHVNVAPSQLAGPDFAQSVTALVGAHGLVPGQLVLEITESGLIADITATQATLAELRRAGVAISLDDFGVGNSSLSRLNDIELDSVKIDRTFVDRIDSEPRRAAFLRALLRLADDISLPVIAEGVETRRQLAKLERLGCPLAQGYLLGRPCSAADTAARLGLPGPEVPTTPVNSSVPSQRAVRTAADRP